MITSSKMAITFIKYEWQCFEQKAKQNLIILSLIYNSTDFVIYFKNYKLTNTLIHKFQVMDLI